tara:strand:- start:14 stop:247 length:234 start_codon:yes stop_codon:yes gene_type:complete
MPNNVTTPTVPIMAVSANVDDVDARLIMTLMKLLANKRQGDITVEEQHVLDTVRQAISHVYTGEEFLTEQGRLPFGN